MKVFANSLPWWQVRRVDSLRVKKRANLCRCLEGIWSYLLTDSSFVQVLISVVRKSSTSFSCHSICLQGSTNWKKWFKVTGWVLTNHDIEFKQSIPMWANQEQAITTIFSKMVVFSETRTRNPRLYRILVLFNQKCPLLHCRTKYKAFKGTYQTAYEM